MIRSALEWREAAVAGGNRSRAGGAHRRRAARRWSDPSSAGTIGSRTRGFDSRVSRLIVAFCRSSALRVPLDKWWSNGAHKRRRALDRGRAIVAAGVQRCDHRENAHADGCETRDQQCRDSEPPSQKASPIRNPTALSHNRLGVRRCGSRAQSGLGVRRFDERTKIICDGKIIALVGPNEAGKSTILDAIERLDDELPISLLERTRGTRPADAAVVVKALWMIEPADLQAIEIPPGSQTPRWLIVDKAFAGARALTLTPALRRDRGPRQRLVKHIEKVKDKPWFVTLDEDEESVFDRSSLDDLIRGLADERATISPATIQRLREVADQIDARAEGAPVYAKDMPAQLRAVADHEAADHPTDVL